MSTKEKIEFIDKVLVNTYPWNKNLKNLLIHKVKRVMPNVMTIAICDDSLDNYYVCVIYKDETIHSLYEINDDFVIEQLYDLALFIKED